MKKISFLLMCLFSSMMMQAGEITEAQALQKAQQILKGRQLVKERARTRGAEATAPAYYVFNAEANGGFAIIASNDQMPEVLGYAEQGHLNLAQVPDNVKWLLDYYEGIAKSLKKSSARGRRAGTRSASERTELVPLLKTEWNQDGIYQDQCPDIDGTKTLTGCVATAMAQVVNFFQWPLNSVREAVGYTSNKDDAEKKIDLPSLPARKFNWFNMTNGDIAWLMRYCGQSVLMDYKTDRVDSPDDLIRRYSAQLSLYKETLEGILRLPVREVWLYGFSRGMGEIRME